MTDKNHCRPKRADCGRGQTTMARQPGHRGILWNYARTANPKGDIRFAANSDHRQDADATGGANSASPIACHTKPGLAELAPPALAPPSRHYRLRTFICYIIPAWRLKFFARPVAFR